MNERIRELKRQAMLFAQEKCGGQTTDMRGNLRSDIWTEKFAQLIAQECAIIADQPSAWQPGYNIRKHFGVNE